MVPKVVMNAFTDDRLVSAFRTEKAKTRKPLNSRPSAEWMRKRSHVKLL
jgi:hypothetical protein